MKRIIFILLLTIGSLSSAYSQVCNGSLTVTITGSDTNLSLSATEEHTDLSCNSASGTANGTITLTVAGGSTDYTFDWADIVGADDGQNRMDLEAGSYSVTITDANGCTTALGPIEITQPDAVDLSNSEVTQPSCNALSGTANGAITITPTGGTVTTGYTYNWETADGAGLVQTDKDQSALSGGTYNLTVTDNNNCTYTSSFVLTEPDAVGLSDSEVTQPSCAAASGAANGAITITAEGGTVTTGYTYNWETTDGSGLVQTDKDQSGLSGGTYNLTVSDNNNCTYEIAFTLTEPVAVTCEATSPTVGAGGTNILCNGGTGTINVVGTGGSGVYTYSLDNGTFQSSGAFADVAAGAHSITVRDDAGCESICSVTLTEPSPLTAGSCNYIQDLCQLGLGEIKIEASGGVAPYIVTYVVTPVAPNTVAGTLDQASPQTIATDGGSVTFTGADGNNQYSFIVTDANGCQIP